MSAKRKNETGKGSLLLRYLKVFVITVAVIFLLLIAFIFINSMVHKIKTERRQNSLKSFYDTSGLAEAGALGEVLRSEPLNNVQLKNGMAQRIIYRTQKSSGANTFSSGMVFIPHDSSSDETRPVVAWAHGTVGMGDQCAPSRTEQPAGNIPWVDEMLERGWVVTATDYAGLGTPGIQGYLIGGDEARDVLNSVRAVRNIPAANAGAVFTVWGHSQGGHSALFAASTARSYAPELELAGVAAAAPAAQLNALFKESTDVLNWVIGSYVLSAWPTVYQNLDVKSVTTEAGYKNYQKIADQCVTQAALGGLVRSKLRQQFFSSNPASAPGWQAAIDEQTAPAIDAGLPTLIAESLTDQVVAPNTTALYMERSCQAGSNLNQLWVTDVGHVQLANTVSPQVIGWLADRFASRPATSTCSQPLPLTPASP